MLLSTRLEIAAAQARISQVSKDGRECDTLHGFMVPADAIAIGLTTALRRGFNGKAPRTAGFAFTDCVCTRADGTMYVMGTAGNTRIVTPQASNRIGAANMAPLGDSNH